MKTLKKVLALALVMALSLSLFASAASDYGDADEISASKMHAIETLYALDIMIGDTEGNFNPTDNVSRAEMAKMVAVILHSGNDDQAFWTTQTSDLFWDVYMSHWANGYINFAQKSSIIVGYGDGTFLPDDGVSYAEAAKMLLVLAGYTPDKANLIGTDWDTNAIALGAQNSLFDFVDVSDYSADATREDIAQMINNALYMSCVLWSTNENGFVQDEEVGNRTDGDEYTVAEKYLSLYTVEGIYAGNGDFTVEGIGNVDDGEIAILTAQDVVGANQQNNTKESIATYDADLSLIGEHVYILYRDEPGIQQNERQLDKADTVYGMFPTNETDVYYINKDDVKDATANHIKFGDEELDFATANNAANFEVWFNFANLQTTAVTGYDNDTTVNTVASVSIMGTGYRFSPASKVETDDIKSNDQIKVVTDVYGNARYAFITETRYASVLDVTDEKVSLEGVVPFNLSQTITYDGLAAGDIVGYTKYFKEDVTNKDAVILVDTAEVIEGAITAVKRSGTVANGTDRTQIEFDDSEEFINMGHYVDVNDHVEDFDDQDDLREFETNTLIDETYAVVTDGKFWVDAMAITNAMPNYAVVLELDDSNDVNQQVKLLLADDTEATFYVDDDSHSAFTAQDIKNDNKPIGALIKYALNGDTATLYPVSNSATENGTVFGAKVASENYVDNELIYSEDSDRFYLTKNVATNTRISRVTSDNAVAFIGYYDYAGDLKWDAVAVEELSDVRTSGYSQDPASISKPANTLADNTANADSDNDSILDKNEIEASFAYKDDQNYEIQAFAVIANQRATTVEDNYNYGYITSANTETTGDLTELDVWTEDGQVTLIVSDQHNISGVAYNDGDVIRFPVVADGEYINENEISFIAKADITNKAKQFDTNANSIPTIYLHDSGSNDITSTTMGASKIAVRDHNDSRGILHSYDNNIEYQMTENTVILGIKVDGTSGYSANTVGKAMETGNNTDVYYQNALVIWKQVQTTSGNPGDVYYEALAVIVDESGLIGGTIANTAQIVDAGKNHSLTVDTSTMAAVDTVSVSNVAVTVAGSSSAANGVAVHAGDQVTIAYTVLDGDVPASPNKDKTPQTAVHLNLTKGTGVNAVPGGTWTVTSLPADPTTTDLSVGASSTVYTYTFAMPDYDVTIDSVFKTVNRVWAAADVDVTNGIVEAANVVDVAGVTGLEAAPSSIKFYNNVDVFENVQYGNELGTTPETWNDVNLSKMTYVAGNKVNLTFELQNTTGSVIKAGKLLLDNSYDGVAGDDVIVVPTDIAANGTVTVQMTYMITEENQGEIWFNEEVSGNLAGIFAGASYQYTTPTATVKVGTHAGVTVVTQDNLLNYGDTTMTYELNLTQDAIAQLKNGGKIATPNLKVQVTGEDAATLPAVDTVVFTLADGTTTATLDDTVAPYLSAEGTYTVTITFVGPINQDVTGVEFYFEV